MTRKEANLEIVDILREMAERFPNLRFKQLLESLGVTYFDTPEYHEESTETFNKLEVLYYDIMKRAKERQCR